MSGEVVAREVLAEARRKREDEFEKLAKVLPVDGGGGPPHDSGMDPWQPAITRLDDKIDSQFKWLLGTYGAGFMILLIAFATGFLVLLTRVDHSFDKVDTKLDALSAAVNDLRTDVAVLKSDKPR